MQDKFDLKKMQEEIKDDEKAQSAKMKIVTQDDIKEIIRERKKRRTDVHD